MKLREKEDFPCGFRYWKTINLSFSRAVNPIPAATLENLRGVSAGASRAF
ncbi:hypothetical protein NECAME_13827 [Necator americanus]|uniref:Uncharacterized protein n=1 Tax=Necator americanus TaxID=51031 RepID=W2SS12_NECAM|nr:hypothetical protein NECAME_13827 [Necator americanus]ETN72539.1 hypothetical protein NECAME_13827 [Necator americanus]